MVLQEIAAYRLFSLGGSAVTLGGVLTALAIVAAAMLAARLVARGLRRVRGRARHGADSLYLVEKIASYGLVVAGFFIALSALGLNLTSLAVFAGALGVGVGLGLQGIVREFVSGLVVIFDRLIQVGDFVELESGVSGVVQEVGPRATRIRTNDNLTIIVPNSKLVDSAVTNWTLKGQTRRIHVPFTVAYGVDKEKVREAVLEAARAVPFTLPDSEAHKTQVWLTGFGDSALEFELVVWPAMEAVKRPAAMQAAYAWAIDDALRKACVEIPFPQLDVRVRSLFGREGGAALETLGLERAPAEAPAPEAASPSHNDAAEDLVASARTEAAEARESEAEQGRTGR